MTIGKKLGLGFGAVLLLMVLTAAIVYWAIAIMNRKVDAVVDQAFPSIAACDRMLNALNHSIASLRGMLLLGDDPKHADFFRGDRRSAWTQIDTALGELIRLYAGTTDAEDIRNFDIVRTTVESLRQAQQKVEDLAQNPDKSPALQALESESVPRGVIVRDALERMRKRAQERMQPLRDELVQAGHTATAAVIGTTLLAIVIGAALATLLSRRIVATIRGLLTRVQRVAVGDLRDQDMPVASRDEIGQLAEGFNQMVRSLRELLAESSRLTGEVTTASSEIATGAQQQLSSLTQTASSLNQISTTSEELKAISQEFADRARSVAEAANEVASRIASGRHLMQDSMGRMDLVRNNAQAAGQSVLDLSEQMQRIGEITATINEIAEQTKLLALNASIEAARAGEQGRGFAVVAAQVRELANQSKEAAGHIESLIADIRKSMESVVDKIESGSRLSEDATELVRQVSRAFEEVAQVIEQTQAAMGQIAAGARQQEQGISELATSITQIDTASKESLTAAEQTQRSIVSIDQRIRVLNESIARFRVA
jgi:methyl-accepting chemotaxis protein